MTFFRETSDILTLNENELGEEACVEVTTTGHDAHVLEIKLKAAQTKIRQQELEIKEQRKECNESHAPKSKLFQEDELRFLGKGTMRGSSWSYQTIKKALRIRFSCGAAGYEVV